MIITNIDKSISELQSTNTNIFEEYTLTEPLNLLIDSPKINKIVEFLVYPKIKNINFINNKKEDLYFLSNEGYYKNFNKLNIELDIDQKIIYTTKTKSEYVYNSSINTLKNVSIPIPESINEHNTYNLFKSGKIQINPYVENIYARKINDHNIYRAILFLIEVKFFV